MMLQHRVSAGGGWNIPLMVIWERNWASGVLKTSLDHLFSDDVIEPVLRMSLHQWCSGNVVVLSIVHCAMSLDPCVLYCHAPRPLGP